MTMHKALPPRDAAKKQYKSRHDWVDKVTDSMRQEKKEEEYLLALKLALMHRYNDSKTT